VWIRGEATIDLTAHDWCLLTSAGIVTGIPLFLFAMAAQKLPYSLMGMLQFIVPTLQFIIGIVVYHETLSLPSALAFVLIWSGVGCYIYDRLQHFLRQD
jgi:chloramphenicol-sensitive protein RarD